MNPTPKLSIIIPVYNVEQYIRECLDSIKNQTFTDFEVLLIDDGSPDGSGSICDEYANIDPRFKVWHKENGGVSSARNVGLDNAQGEWIHFIDPDDYLISENVYEEILEELGKEEFDMIYFGSKMGDDNYFLPSQITNKNKLYREDLLEIFFEFFNAWWFLFKKEKLKGCKFPNLKTGQDTLFTQMVILRRIWSMLVINKAYVFYRIHPLSTTMIYQASRMDDFVFHVEAEREEIRCRNLDIDHTAYNNYVIRQFFWTLIKIEEAKDIEFLEQIIKKYAVKINVSNILSWQYVFDKSKPILPYLLLKLKLYKLLAKDIKKRYNTIQ